jgi:hypothetical protein
MLDLAFGLTRTSRLGCQVIADKSLDGIVVRLPAVRAHTHGQQCGVDPFLDCHAYALSPGLICAGDAQLRGGQAKAAMTALQEI